MPIIIEGGSRSAGWWWARHLTNTEKNERAELIEISGLDSANVPALFRELHALSLGTKCDNHFYQANINPRADEQLTPAQWREAVDTLEKNLGLEGQPRFVIEHEKEGRTHRHVVWSRIDLEQMKAIPDSLTARIHEQTSRELEIKFDLQRGKSILVPDRDFERPERRAKKHERFRGAQNGIDPRTINDELRVLRERRRARQPAERRRSQDPTARASGGPGGKPEARAGRAGDRGGARQSTRWRAEKSEDGRVRASPQPDAGRDPRGMGPQSDG
jgi:hypothetical protein